MRTILLVMASLFLVSCASAPNSDVMHKPNIQVYLCLFSSCQQSTSTSGQGSRHVDGGSNTVNDYEKDTADQEGPLGNSAAPF